MGPIGLPSSSMSADAPVEPPVVPGYVLETLLGRGGSGEVWRAVPRAGGAPVAVKVLVQGDPERQAREAALLGELDHPHLVRLIEVVHQPRRGGVMRVALVLELLEGGSLAALLARRGRLRPGEVVTTIAPVAAALAHAHDRGVVHGDLSPGNIVFTAEGRPVLTDLGVARLLGEAGTGEVTPAYVDPTVARGGASGPASDVFGVAAAAFHALTGIAPWNAATAADTLAVAAAGSLPDLDELAPEAPGALLEVIHRGLAADPHQRGSAAAFALDLRHAVRPEPVRLPREGVPDAELGRTGRGPRTELTHEVPGRRPRPAPVVADAVRGTPRPRWAAIRGRLRPRRPARPVPAVALVVAGLLVTGWAGSRWGAGGEAGGAVAAAASAAPAESTPSPAERSPDEPAGAGPAGADSADGEPSDGAPPVAEPATVQEWRAVIEELYRLRGQAFGAGSAEVLDQVYAADSPLLAADAAHLGSLAAAGEVLRGFVPRVVEVTDVRVSGDQVEVRLVDRWPEYAVVRAGAADGPVLRAGPARAAADVRMVLVRAPAGWRIATAERLP